MTGLCPRCEATEKSKRLTVNSLLEQQDRDKARLYKAIDEANALARENDELRQRLGLKPGGFPRDNYT